MIFTYPLWFYMHYRCRSTGTYLEAVSGRSNLLSSYNINIRGGMVQNGLEPVRMAEEAILIDAQSYSLYPMDLLIKHCLKKKFRHYIL